MFDRKLRKRLYSAFEAETPDVIGRVLVNCGEQLSQQEPAKPRGVSLMRMAALATALALILVGTVTAISFYGLIPPDDAQYYAMIYVVRNADSEEEGKDLENLILAGLSYDLSASETSVTLKIFGLRPVYQVSFKAGGYTYFVDIDAKTGVALSLEKELDSNWQEHLDEVAEEHESRHFYGILRQSPPCAGSLGELTLTEIYMICEDTFGLDDMSQRKDCDGSLTGLSTCDLWNGRSTHIVQILHGGYIYEVRMDADTGEIIEKYVAEDADYTGVRHLHEKSDSRIGLFRAYRLIKDAAPELLGAEPEFIASPNYTALEEPGDFPGEDCYFAAVSDGEKNITVYVSASTGELIGFTSVDEGDRVFDIPSAESPEGLISEAEAQLIALDSAGVSVNELVSFSIRLEAGQYKMEFVTADGRNLCMNVDAVTGMIV